VSSNVAGEFDNSEYQKELGRILLKKLNSQPDTARTPEQIYEDFFEPLPHRSSQGLIEYLVERMVQHDDGIIGWCGDDSEKIQVTSGRVGEYIQTHLKSAGDPFPEVDPTPFEQS